ncbi:hypothetical protein MNBD_DELTA01-1624 [hydrothermal vent metagenome]|uniref:Uncharacterized protein n=1 Tax=hydrothermal vent metagenome TaxID=652676 RepID=A0A3B0R3S0_9ZZZZ
MAATTYTWNTIASTQTDGDSPLDETLMEAIRQNLISLEEWMGDGFAQAKDHDHDGVSSALITELGGNSVSQSSMQDSAIGQAELKTAMGSVSNGGNRANLTLPGGEYGFYPQIKANDTSGGEAYMLSHYATTSYVTNITIQGYSDEFISVTVYAQQRYIQASPPYNLGNGDIPLFIFAMVNKSTGKIEATYTAEDPPWAYNGPKRINPNKVFNRDGKKYLKRTKRPWSHAEAKADKVKLIENLAATKTPVVEEVEITHSMKNAGMSDIPHPFASLDPATHTVVLLDPCSSLCLDLYELAQEADEGTTEIAELLHEGRIIADNTVINGLITPPGVMGVKMRLG